MSTNDETFNRVDAVWSLLSSLLMEAPWYWRFPAEQRPSAERPLCLRRLGWDELMYADFWVRLEALLGVDVAPPPEQQQQPSALFDLACHVGERAPRAALAGALARRKPSRAAAVVERLGRLADPFELAAGVQRARRYFAVERMSRSVLLFPGQGVQAVGMGVAEAALCPAAAQLFATASDVLGYDLLRLCADGPAEALDQTEVCQVAVFVCSLANVELLRQYAPHLIDQCVAAAGLSLGEYAALVFAGVCSFTDGLRLVAARAKAMQAAASAQPSSGMTSLIGQSTNSIVNVLTLINRDLEQQRHAVASSSSSSSSSSLPVKAVPTLWPANYLLDSQITVAGVLPALDMLESRAEKMGIKKAVRLKVSGGFHCPLMEPAHAQLQLALARAKINKARIPVIFNVDPYQSWQDPPEPLAVKAYLLKQLTHPVKWSDTMQLVCSKLPPTDGSRLAVVPVGPGTVTDQLFRRHLAASAVDPDAKKAVHVVVLDTSKIEPHQ